MRPVTWNRFVGIVSGAVISALALNTGIQLEWIAGLPDGGWALPLVMFSMGGAALVGLVCGAIGALSSLLFISRGSRDLSSRVLLLAAAIGGLPAALLGGTACSALFSTPWGITTLPFIGYSIVGIWIVLLITRAPDMKAFADHGEAAGI